MFKNIAVAIIFAIAVVSVAVYSCEYPSPRGDGAVCVNHPLYGTLCYKGDTFEYSL